MTTRTLHDEGHDDRNHGSDETTPGPPPRDDLDAMLRRWHEVNADDAAAGRDALLSRLAGTHATGARRPAPHSMPPVAAGRRLHPGYLRAAASLAILVSLCALLVPALDQSAAAAARTIAVPDGGRLDALDEQGRLIGPCPLEHTDVEARIAGRFTRVTLTQRYANPYDRAIEAVYTFPLSHRGAVDRMTMTVGDRVVVGEVRERQAAREIYEAARAQGYVASLLEQERPNIFTQSIANIEPGAEVVVEISYVELVEVRDGLHTFAFPMVVGPRYVPGRQTVSRALLPAELTSRHGVTLLGPASLTITETGAIDRHGALQPGKLAALLEAAQAIEFPGTRFWGTRAAGDPGADAGAALDVPPLWHRFEATYCDGATELGVLCADGTGEINGRWFLTDPAIAASMGSGFAPDTDQVPDASRITPLPVRPERRAGHDISVRVTVDSGGPAVVGLSSALHEVREVTDPRFADLGNRVTMELAGGADIPNRDLVLSWRLADDAIGESHFVHASPKGRFFTLMLQPPARIEPEAVRPRELIFVMDTSGSMRGRPIEASKAVMDRALKAMRPTDTFNVITFSGSTSILWNEPRPATPENVAAARALVASQQGGGGTEMMQAIRAALQPTAGDAPLDLETLANLAADGREVVVGVPGSAITSLLQDGAAPSVMDLRVRDDLSIRARARHWTLQGGRFHESPPDGRRFTMRGRWTTEDGRRVLDDVAATDEPAAAAPLRVVMFLTDGYVGNDEAIVAAVREHARTTRVFGFGIGNSVNRFLLDAMSTAGRGAVEQVLLNDDADEAVERFVRRIDTPVLTDIELVLSDGLEVRDTIPPLDPVPDLFDERPLIIHGRYDGAGEGTLTIRGRTGQGRYERVVELSLPDEAPEHDVIATLWARARVDELSAQDDRDAIVELGERFQILTKHTSFVAVEKSRMTVGGEPMLVAVPIEMPDGVTWEGIFGGHSGAELAVLERRRDRVDRALAIDANGQLALGQTSLGLVTDGTEVAVPGLQVVQLEDTPFASAVNGVAGAKTALGDIPIVFQGGTDNLTVGYVVNDLGGGGGFGGGGGAPVDVKLQGSTSEISPTTDHYFALGDAYKSATVQEATIDSIGKVSLAVQPLDEAELRRITEQFARVRAGLEVDARNEEAPEAPDIRFADPQGEGLVVLHEKLGQFTSGMDGRADKAGETKALARIPMIETYFKNLVPAQEMAERAEAEADGDGGADGTLLAEQVVLDAAALARKGADETARELADALVEARPTFKLGVALRDVLADDGLPQEQRTARVDDLAESARALLVEARERLDRAARLRRVVDPRLWPLLDGDASKGATETPIMVSVLTTDLEPATIAALEQAGLTIDDRAETRHHVVGRIDVDRLRDLALLEVVRRVEPV